MLRNRVVNHKVVQALVPVVGHTVYRDSQPAYAGSISLLVMLANMNMFSS